MILRVSTLLQWIGRILTTEPGMHRIEVEGEVADYYASRDRRYMSFSLKEREAKVSVIWWMAPAKAGIQNGDHIIVTGSVGVYDRRGSVQITASSIRPAGVGDSLVQLRLLKEKLAREGIFAPEKKREIPRFSNHVGLITSSDGAALYDVRRTVASRYPLLRLTLSPSLVQGADAPRQLVEAMSALLALHQKDPMDLILIVRGGGSADDLQAFNDERLVRAIADCPLPVVTGIGHETDLSLADLAADASESTPTKAAMRITQDRQHLLAWINESRQQMQLSLKRDLAMKRSAQEKMHLQLLSLRPSQRLTTQRLRLETQERLMRQLVATQLERRRSRINRQKIAAQQGALGFIGSKKRELKVQQRLLSEQRDRQIRHTTWRVESTEGHPLWAGALDVGGRYILRAEKYRYEIRVEKKESNHDG